ncbi:hypothetical protein [Rubinisphaera margarita]|uniref:hypothetical protein n=1 Tax=Rubinisphaera margarita TaxID=2909586 RepID=UPI001EE83D42|nr:hypothetical protein [Rubinisphaera margarita]MCG6158333.1 hypothetical protein [Rubinisphaera margarita]
MKALLAYPTHRNLAEELERYEAAEIDAAAYPVRATTEAEDHAINCWNPEADQAEQIGLPVVKTICNGCEYRSQCADDGYLAQMQRAREATVSLVTHQRLSKSGFEELAGERPFASVHEDVLTVLRPEMTLTLQDLFLVRHFVDGMVGNPKHLDWYSSDELTTRDGEVIQDQDLVVKRQRIYEAMIELGNMLEDLENALNAAETTQAWHSPVTIKTPPGFESFLWRVLKYERVRFEESPWRFILAALTGQLYAGMIIVTEHHVKGAPQGTTVKFRKAYGVVRNDPPAGKTVWFSDATADQDTLESLLDGRVIDATPGGVVPLQKKAEQYHRDITRKTQPAVLRSLIRGLLCKYLDRIAVGVITHSNLLPAIEKLEPEFRDRIIKTSYYGSGDERSSNDWYRHCDLILVLGTPRVPATTVIEYLIRIGEWDAACAASEWGEIYWHAETTDGEDLKLSGRGYYDPLWMTAHRAIVRANVVQAIGRGRGILKDGCDVIVLSSEECGLRVINDRPPTMNDQLVRVWGLIQELTARNLKLINYTKLAVSTSEVADAAHVPLRTARYLLSELESLNLIHREGPRSGWLRGPAPASQMSSAPDSAGRDNSNPDPQTEGV